MHSDYIAFMCFVWIYEETVTFALYTVNRLVFITEVESVYCTVRAESLYKTDKFHPLRVKEMFTHIFNTLPEKWQQP